MDTVTSCCTFDASQIPWFLGAVGGAFITLVGVGIFYLAKGKLRIGMVRPQVLLVLTGLTVIGISALLLGHSNVTSIAVGGMIALTMRIIETDKGDGDNDQQGAEE